MIVYPENNYVVEIVDNSMKDTFSIWFKEKPEEIVEHLLKAIGFKMRSGGEEFYYPNEADHRLFAEELQRSLRSGCLPKSIPYKTSFEQTVSSITAENFSIATFSYVDSEGVLATHQKILFERSTVRSKSLAWIIGKILYGENFKGATTTYRTGVKEGIILFKNGEFVSSLPDPFGSDCLPAHDTHASADKITEEKNGRPDDRLDNGSDDRSEDRTEGVIEDSGAIHEIAETARDFELSKDGTESGENDGLDDSPDDGFSNGSDDGSTENESETFEEKKSAGVKKLPIDYEVLKNNRPEITAPIYPPYTYLYLKLHELIPNLVHEIEEMVADDAKPTYYKSRKGTYNEKGIYEQGALLDANFEFLYKDKEGRYVISLSHYFEQNGDLVPDPDMAIRIDPLMQTAEALYFQNQLAYFEVYEQKPAGEKVDKGQKKSQNDFLQLWLRNLVNQGHFFDIPKLAEEQMAKAAEESEEKGFIEEIAENSENVVIANVTDDADSASGDKDANSPVLENLNQLVPIESVTYSIKDSDDGLINVQHWSKNWQDAEAYFQKVVHSGGEKGNIVEFTAKWQNGMIYKSKIVLNEKNLDWYKGENIIAFNIVKGILTQLYYSKGRIQGKVSALAVAQKKMETALDELDFGTSIQNAKEVLQPKVALASITVGIDEALNLSPDSDEIGIVAHALGQLELGENLVGVQAQIAVIFEWEDGHKLNIELDPFRLQSTLPSHYFYDLLKEEQDFDFVKKYQSMDGQALLFKSEVKPVNQSMISKSLMDSMWKESDTNKRASVMVRGITYHKGRLMINLLATLTSIPFQERFEILQEFSKAYDRNGELGALLDTSVETEAEIDRFERLYQLTLVEILEDSKAIAYSNSEAFAWLVDRLSEHEEQFVDSPIQTNVVANERKSPKGVKRLQLNEQIENLIDEKGNQRENYSDEEMQLLEKYSGYGGLAAGGVRSGALYEYYTPEPLVQKMYGLAFHHGFRRGSILEPTVGTGRFVKYAPSNTRIVGYETNKYSATICKLLYPHASIYNKAFETVFFNGNIHLKDNFQLEPFDLAIGNPPYGEFTGKYAGMGERKHTQATEYDQYFMLRGLDVLKPGGLLVYLISTHFYKAKKAYGKVKRKIAEKAMLMDFYDLPNGSLKHTDVGTSIIVLKKR